MTKPTINLTRTQDAERAFNTALRTEPRGTRIVYHEGPCLHNVTRLKVGRAAADAYAAKKAVLVQKRVSDGMYQYIAVVM